MKNKLEQIHYIYTWSTKEYGILYVGQGKKTSKNPYRRAFSNHIRQKFLQSGIEKLNSEINVNIISDNLTKEEANFKEEYIINLLGRIIKKDGKLYNISCGGSVETKNNKKPIFINDMWFESIQECAEYYGISHGKVCHCLRDGRDIVEENRSIKIVLYNGIEYTGYKELSEKYNIPIHVVSHRLKKNIPLDIELRTAKKVLYNGVEYIGYKELAKIYGLTVENVKRRLKNNIPLEEPVIKRVRVIIDGIEYKSICEAVRETNYTAKYIQYWIKRGKFKIIKVEL